MAVSDIDPAKPQVGVPALERTTQGANITEIKVALLDHASRLTLLEGGSLGTGDMTKAIYDPQLVQGDAFARANHTGTQALSTIVSGTANTLVGRDAAGATSEITAGSNITINAGVISATGAGGGGNVVDDTTPQLGGDLDVNGQSIVSVSNGNIPITPNGSGRIILDGLTWPDTDGTNGQVLKTNGAGSLTFQDDATGGGGGSLNNVVEDLTPQLGGDLDINGRSLVSVSNGNIPITPNGTGSVVLDGLNWPQADGTADQVLKTDGAGNLSFTDQTGGGGAVSSVFTRTGAVAAQSGDYGANQITFAPTGNIAATDTQAAIAELDTEKLSTADGSLASALTAITLAEIDPAADLMLVWDNSAGALKRLAWSQLTEEIVISASDETTDLTTGTAKTTFRMPFAMTLTGVRSSVNTAPTGATLTVDINEGGASILSTKLTIDAGEKTSTTAAAAAVISDSALADDAEITIDIDQIGSTVAGRGLKVTLIGTRP